MKYLLEILAAIALAAFMVMLSLGLLGASIKFWIDFFTTVAV